MLVQTTVTALTGAAAVSRSEIELKMLKYCLFLYIIWQLCVIHYTAASYFNVVLKVAGVSNSQCTHNTDLLLIISIKKTYLHSQTLPAVSGSPKVTYRRQIIDFCSLFQCWVNCFVGLH
ncbi:hypothetical protein EB796_011587 [Bugula neritina]|uniref:Uncharacterized protein n=1 Tax=Bugula neritina TaxID=10212 RepID=A0A7J7JVX4_BUGNE|nr:hypothetical protein EB796_011587 [Bugula neritina]